MASVVDITQRFRMVSVVVVFLWFPSSQETFFNGFRRWLFYGFRRGRKRFFMASVANVSFFMVSVAASNVLCLSRQVTFSFFIAASNLLYRGK